MLSIVVLLQILATPCGDVNYHGNCADGVLTWCGDELLHTIDCAARGQECAWQDDGVGFNCQHPTTACGYLTEQGACTDNQVSRCVNDAIVTVDCGEHDKECGFVANTNRFDCRIDDCARPRVLLVLDQSSSMNGVLADGSTKWEAATAAVNSLVSRFQQTIDFGLMIYPGAALQCAPGEVVVDVGPNTAADIASYLVTPPPSTGSHTPMAETLAGAATHAPLLDSTTQNHVLLVTDGWQFCDPYDSDTRFQSVASVRTLSSLGVETFVLGFGGGVDVLNNNRMATVGGTAIPDCDLDNDDPAASNLCYYQTDAPDELAAAFEQIALTVSGEVCDGKDNDCDGYVDNREPGAPDPLTTPCTSSCGAGESLCQDGGWTTCRAEGACDDGDACTVDDWCANDACTGTPRVCDDQNPTTQDSCDPELGCQYTPIEGPCDDQNACTTDDYFDGTTCQGVPVVCENDDPCLVAHCDPIVGCQYGWAEDGIACDDGDACTTDDFCRDGTCVGVPGGCPDGSGTGLPGDTDDDGNPTAAGGVDSGCGCSTTGSNSLPALSLLGTLIWLGQRRRRGRA